MFLYDIDLFYFCDDDLRFELDNSIYNFLDFIFIFIYKYIVIIVLKLYYYFKNIRYYILWKKMFNNNVFILFRNYSSKEWF